MEQSLQQAPQTLIPANRDTPEQEQRHFKSLDQKTSTNCTSDLIIFETEDAAVPKDSSNGPATLLDGQQTDPQFSDNDDSTRPASPRDCRSTNMASMPSPQSLQNGGYELLGTPVNGDFVVSSVREVSYYELGLMEAIMQKWRDLYKTRHQLADEGFKKRLEDEFIVMGEFYANQTLRYWMLTNGQELEHSMSFELVHLGTSNSIVNDELSAPIHAKSSGAPETNETLKRKSRDYAEPCSSTSKKPKLVQADKYEQKWAVLTAFRDLQAKNPEKTLFAQGEVKKFLEEEKRVSIRDRSSECLDLAILYVKSIEGSKNAVTRAFQKLKNDKFLTKVGELYKLTGKSLTADCI